MEGKWKRIQQRVQCDDGYKRKKVKEAKDLAKDGEEEKQGL